MQWFNAHFFAILSLSVSPRLLCALQYIPMYDVSVSCKKLFEFVLLRVAFVVVVQRKLRIGRGDARVGIL